jgi:hypothetical protein
MYYDYDDIYLEGYYDALEYLDENAIVDFGADVFNGTIPLIANKNKHTKKLYKKGTNIAGKYIDKATKRSFSNALEKHIKKGKNDVSPEVEARYKRYKNYKYKKYGKAAVSVPLIAPTSPTKLPITAAGIGAGIKKSKERRNKKRAYAEGYYDALNEMY